MPPILILDNPSHMPLRSWTSCPAQRLRSAYAKPLLSSVSSERASFAFMLYLYFGQLNTTTEHTFFPTTSTTIPCTLLAPLLYLFPLYAISTLFISTTTSKFICIFLFPSFFCFSFWYLLSSIV